MNNTAPVFYKNPSPSSPRGASRTAVYSAPSSFNKFPVYYVPYLMVASETEPRYDPSALYLMKPLSQSQLHTGLRLQHHLPLTQHHFLPRARYQSHESHKSRHESHEANHHDSLLETRADLLHEPYSNTYINRAAPQLPHPSLLPTSSFLYPVSISQLPYNPITSSAHNLQRFSNHYPLSTAPGHGGPIRRWSLVDTSSTAPTPRIQSSSSSNRIPTDSGDPPRRRRSLKSVAPRNTTRKSHNAQAVPENIRYNVFLQPADDCEANLGTPLQQILDTIKVKKYLTLAIDPQRAYLTVYEYPVNKQSIIWDYETGFVHLTGIWKALLLAEPETSTVTRNNSKADIVKLLETTPKQYQQHIKRIRGGFLKIQGTWLPYEMCKAVAKKFCYRIRYELVPLFGAQFPRQCLTPDNPSFGKLRLDDLDEEILKHGNLTVPSQKAIAAASTTTQIAATSSGQVHALIPETTPPSQPKQILTQMNHDSENKSSPLSSVNLNNSPRYSVCTLQDTNPLHGQEFDKSLRQHVRRSSLPLPVPRPRTESSLNMGHLSYNEMYDLVSALRCLQSLRTGNPTSSNSGIVSILEAAGVSKKQPRRLLKIHDLISE